MEKTPRGNNSLGRAERGTQIGGKKEQYFPWKEGGQKTLFHGWKGGACEIKEKRGTLAVGRKRAR